MIFLALLTLLKLHFYCKFLRLSLISLWEESFLWEEFCFKSFSSHISLFFRLVSFRFPGVTMWFLRFRYARNEQFSRFFQWFKVSFWKLFIEGLFVFFCLHSSVNCWGSQTMVRKVREKRPFPKEVGTYLGVKTSNLGKTPMKNWYYPLFLASIAPMCTSNNKIARRT